MKILFLCGSLNPGYDGVGDYTRLLAVEMIRSGHQAAAIGLNDTYVKEEIECIQHCENIELPCLRLPSSWSAATRIKRAQVWIEKFNPEWLSLQFVLFSFHPKGLPFKLNSFLTSFGKGRRWHLMFHELWVGMPLGASQKHRIWGWFQRRIIFSILTKLKPEVIHTQSHLYFLQLVKMGFKVNYLPLFSNIPVSAGIVKKKETVISVKSPIISLVIFGTIHPFSLIEEFIEEVARYQSQQKAKVKLTIIGRCGTEQANWISTWKAAGLKVEVLGEQPAASISSVLMNASLGISTCAMAMIDKSGTVAAMLAHGLPVLCVAKPWTPRGVVLPRSDKGIFILTEGVLDICLTKLPDKAEHPGASDIAKTLTNLLIC